MTVKTSNQEYSGSNCVYQKPYEDRHFSFNYSKKTTPNSFKKALLISLSFLQPPAFLKRRGSQYFIPILCGLSLKKKVIQNIKFLWGISNYSVEKVLKITCSYK